MGRSQKRKGAAGEREVCHILTDELGEKVTRRINQARDSGCDIEVGAYNIEVKRRARIGQIYDWMEQAAASCEDTEKKPVVVCRADGKKWLAIMPFGDWINLAREAL